MQRGGGLAFFLVFLAFGISGSSCEVCSIPIKGWFPNMRKRENVTGVSCIVQFLLVSTAGVKEASVNHDDSKISVIPSLTRCFKINQLFNLY